MSWTNFKSIKRKCERCGKEFEVSLQGSKYQRFKKYCGSDKNKTGCAYDIHIETTSRKNILNSI